MAFVHKPVLLDECIEALQIRPDGIYVDCTAGGGGHSAAIAEHITTGRLIAFDKDPAALRAASERLGLFGCTEVVESDFRFMKDKLYTMDICQVDGVLMDLGVSSHQLDTPERGFSYHFDAPLDMRMGTAGSSAYDLVNEAPQDELERIIRTYGEERFAYRIARQIIRRRGEKPIRTTGELVEIIKESIPAPARREGGHPAKRTFQALRIAVNDELGALEEGLQSAFDCLKPGGRLAVITFHSLEDRIVKNAFRKWSTGCTCPSQFPVCMCGKEPMARFVGRKPVTASPQELEENNRSRSARLRILERLV